MTERPFFGHLIGGKEVESLDGARFDSVNPWTREVWADVALGSAADAEAAVTAAVRSARGAGGPHVLVVPLTGSSSSRSSS